jgi:serine/threonine protein kinase
MSNPITLPCGHTWQLSPGDTPRPDESIICPVCESSSLIPPPPRQELIAAAALGQRLATDPIDAEPTLTLDVPTTETGWPAVAGYHIVEQLGRGGMGVVYKAIQVSLRRVVALKMLRPNTHGDARELVRFQAEAEAVAHLQHPNIVQIYEIGEQDGQPYFALEHVGGGSLAQKLDGTPLPPRQAAHLVEPLARAMHHAHQQGIIHRDLKPANVLLAVSDRADAVALGGPGLAARVEPKITDFGLVKRTLPDEEQAGNALTQSGAIVGTPAYMSPEQAEGKGREIGPLADVYALGVILYEALTGRPPFRGATLLDTLEQVRSVEPVSPRRLQPKCPRDLETICLKCLNKDPAGRYLSAEALAEDLRRFLAGQPIVARPITRRERAWRWCRRNPMVASLTVGVVLLLAIGLPLGSWMWSSRSESLQKAAHAEQKVEHVQKSNAAALAYIAASGLGDAYSKMVNGSGTKTDRIARDPAIIQSVEQACALGEELLKDDPGPAMQSALARSYAKLSVLQAAARQRDKAIASCRRGLELLDHSIQEAKEVAGTPGDLGRTYYVLGAVLMILQRHEEASRAFEQSVAQLRSDLDAAPMDTGRRKALSISYYHLAHTQLQSGKVAESAATALERQQLWSDNADEVYDAVCETARCIGKAKSDEERQRYTAQAIDVLRRAVGMGLKNAKAVQTDAELAPLRERADFQQLVADVAKNDHAVK